MNPPRVLMVAYHFPPLAGSSGIQRTLRFVQHLPALGWEPIVLSADARAYERTSPDMDADIPAGTVVRRAFALDTARHLCIRGRYIGAMARPDRWVTWRFDGVRQGLRLVRTYQPDVLWSTYPIATAHLIGHALHQRTGLPWIADFRDPMAQDGYPTDPVTHRQFLRIERDAVESARFSVFTTPGAAAEYRQRYPHCADRIVVIENGYDEPSFAQAEADEADRTPLQPGCFTLLHSGIVYPSERDPTQLMGALAILAQQGAIRPGSLCVRFRAAVQDDLLMQLAAERGVSDYIEIAPPVPYRVALQEMLRADALLAMQASNCNAQIPAKVYEYLRAGRPIVCLSDPAGDTAGVLREAGVELHARLDDAQDIANALKRMLDTDRPLALPRVEAVRRASRAGRAQAMAELLARARRPD